MRFESDAARCVKSSSHHTTPYAYYTNLKGQLALKPMGRGPTAYFLFADDVREAVQAEVRAANEGKASVALVGKAIGERWKALTDDERLKYKTSAAEMAKSAAETNAETDNAEEDPSSSSSGPTMLPISLVKRMMLLDPEVSRVSSEGLSAVSLATTIFLGALAEQAQQLAAGAKRKTLRFADVRDASRRYSRQCDMGLYEGLVQLEKKSAESQEEGIDDAAPAKKTQAAGAADAKGAATLRAFFAPIEGNENLVSAEENAATND